MNLPAGFEPSIARELCLLSHEAYDCLKGHRDNPIGGVIHENFAFIVRRQAGRTLIAFQGSNDVKDFILDACAVIQHPSDEPTFPAVHSGFWKAVRALLEPLRAELSRWQQPLILGGHSLGGAIATLFAVILAEQGYKIEAVYGFGTPPVGAVQFFNYYRTLGLAPRTFLTIYRRDGVPFMQPCGVSVVEPIFIDDRAQVLKERPSFSIFRPFAALTDHSASNYLTSLDKLEDRMRE